MHLNVAGVDSYPPPPPTHTGTRLHAWPSGITNTWRRDSGRQRPRYGRCGWSTKRTLQPHMAVPHGAPECYTPSGLMVASAHLSYNFQLYQHSIHHKMSRCISPVGGGGGVLLVMAAQIGHKRPCRLWLRTQLQIGPMLILRSCGLDWLLNRCMSGAKGGILFLIPHQHTPSML